MPAVDVTRFCGMKRVMVVVTDGKITEYRVDVEVTFVPRDWRGLSPGAWSTGESNDAARDHGTRCGGIYASSDTPEPDAAHRSSRETDPSRPGAVRGVRQDARGDRTSDSLRTPWPG